MGDRSSQVARRGRFAIHKTTLLRCAGALLVWTGWLFVSGPASALTLGPLTVVSAASEPFRAEVEVRGLPPSVPRSALQARLASPQAYGEAGDRYPESLQGLRLDGFACRGMTCVVTVVAPSTAAEPRLRLRLELSWPRGRQSAVYEVEPQAGSRAEPLGRADAAAGGEAAARTLTVQPGDTLSGIAVRLRSPGVTLDQTMVALFRANPRAFAGNVNVLLAGAELLVPPPQAVLGLAPEQARSEVRAQAEAFERRRQEAALQPLAVTAVDARRATGRIELAPPQTTAAPVAPADRLTLAPAASPSGPSTAVPASDPRADDAARMSALAAAEDNRRKEAEIERLNALLRQLQREREAASTAQSPADAVLPAVSAAQALEARLLAQPWWVATALGLVAAVVVVGLVLLLRQRRPALPETRFLPSRYDDDAAETSTGLGPRRPDTAHGGGAAGSGLTVEQALAPFDASGDVDPVAEAQMYLGYGRDRQAQEILTESMLADPSRLDVQVKLLEIHALRREPEAFMGLARQLRSRCGGQGPHWEQACALAGAMGLSLGEAPMAAPVGSVGGVDVDLAFDTRPVSDDGASAQPAEPPLGGLGLILDDEAAPALPMPSAQTLERKLDLADEFVTIGDPEAARDLLNEVLAQGDTVLQARAQSALSRLG